MSSRNWIIIIIVVVLALGGWFLVAHSLKSMNSANATPTPTMAMSSMAPQSSTSASSNPQSSQTQSAGSVTIQNFAFSPAAITVKKGTTVTWTNKDSAGHTVTESDGQSGPTSGTLSNGQSYTFTFNTVGTFHYKCNIHPSMTGTVTVTE